MSDITIDRRRNSPAPSADYLRDLDRRYLLTASLCLLIGLPSVAPGQTRRDSLDVMAAFGQRVGLETSHFQYRLGIGANFIGEFTRDAASRDPGMLPSAALVAAAVAHVGRPITIVPLVRNVTLEIATERTRTIFSRLDRHYWIDSLQFAGESAVLWLSRFTESHEDSTADAADARYIFRRVQGTWQFERDEVDIFTSLNRFTGPRPPRAPLP